AAAARLRPRHAPRAARPILRERHREDRLTRWPTTTTRRPASRCGSRSGSSSWPRSGCGSRWGSSSPHCGSRSPSPATRSPPASPTRSGNGSGATPAATSPDLPRDAVGPEQDAQVGVEAVARVDEVLVGELEDGRAVRPFEVDVDRAVTGVEPQDLLEPVDLL